MQMESQAQDLSKIPEHRRVLFVTPTGQYEKQPEDVSGQTGSSGTLTGAEVRSIYEEILAEVPSTSTDIKPEIPKVKKLSRNKSSQTTESVGPLTERDVNFFLKAAADGDTKTVGQYAQRGLSMDVADSYGWTALHCAAGAGRTSTVLWLVKNGANWSLLDRMGASFADVALKAGHRRLMEIVVEWFESRDYQDEFEPIPDSELPPLRCRGCGQEYRGSERAHQTSLAHLVRVQRSVPAHTGFIIPEWNPGFRLLRKAGWSGDGGLGKEKQGKKFPIRTILKRDRTGLGSKDAGPARVTHFGAHDTRAVESIRIDKSAWKGESKEAREKSLQKEKKIEQDVRWAFRDPR